MTTLFLRADIMNPECKNPQPISEQEKNALVANLTADDILLLFFGDRDTAADGAYEIGQKIGIRKYIVATADDMRDFESFLEEKREELGCV